MSLSSAREGGGDEVADIVTTTPDLRQSVARARGHGASIGFVPTMGYLHDGHQSLIRAADHHCDFVVVSIYVNPTQFGAGEDLDAYPRDLDGDAAKATDAGADLIFAPDTAEMYPSGRPGVETWVEVHGLTDNLCGQFRPGHFRGVTTIVSRLFLKVQPDVAFFGRKDFQQLAVIRQMVRDLDFPVQVEGVPTVREPDGLAMSSRNAYLARRQRAQATALVTALRAASAAWHDGERHASRLLGAAREIFDDAPLVDPEYIELVNPDTLEPLTGVLADGPVLMAVAAHVGTARLIDNARIDVEPSSPFGPGGVG